MSKWETSGSNNVSSSQLISGHDGVETQIVKVGTDGSLATGGSVASGATDSGNPVKVAGKYNLTKPTLTDGQRGDMQLGTRGGLNVNVMDSNGTQGATVAATADGAALASPGLRVIAVPVLSNGTTVDIARANTPVTVFASQARTAAVDSADFTNYNGRGLHVVIDATALAASPGVTFTIQGKDELSGKYYTILASAAVTGVSTTVLKVYPGITVAANLSVSDILPRTWRVSVTVADADSLTYSVGASVIL